MVPGLMSKLPLELRLQIYSYCDSYPNSSSEVASYRYPWSDLPHEHDIGKRIDGAAVANLMSAYRMLIPDIPELLSDLHGIKTLVFSERYEKQWVKKTTMALPHLNSLARLLCMPVLEVELRIAVDIRSWDNDMVTSLFVVLIRTKQTVHLSLICAKVPADLAVLAADTLASRGGSIRIYEACLVQPRHVRYAKCLSRHRFPTQGVSVRPQYWHSFHEKERGWMHEVD